MSASIAGWSLLGGGGLGLVVGGIFGILAHNEADALREKCPTQPCSQDLQSTRDTALTYAHVSTGMFVVGGVLAATGATILIAAPSAPGSGGTTLNVKPLGATLTVGF